MAKKNRNFTENEKITVRNLIIIKIEQVETDLSRNELKEAKDKFIEKFTLCENIYKIVLKQYLKNNETYKTDEKMSLQITQIKTALSKAGYHISEQLLNNIFSSSGKYTKENSRSAKILRNDIDHEMSHNALQEILDRKNELLNYMDEFLRLMREDC